MNLPEQVIWLLAGLVLMLAEFVVPGVFLIWIGLAALGTGLVLVVAFIDFPFQVLLFAGLAVVNITIGLRFRPAKPNTQINTPSSGLVGREAVALEFHGRHGRVRVGDSDWSARLDNDTTEPEPQTMLRVVGVEGTTLVVGPQI